MVPPNTEVVSMGIFVWIPIVHNEWRGFLLYNTETVSIVTR